MTLAAAVSVAGVLTSTVTTLDELEDVDVGQFVQQLGVEADTLLLDG
jgi:hypothetical protein